MPGPLNDRVEARIADLDNKIAWVQDNAKDEIQRLTAQKDALVKAQKLLTAEVEDAANYLKRVGVISL